MAFTSVSTDGFDRGGSSFQDLGSNWGQLNSPNSCRLNDDLDYCYGQSIQEVSSADCPAARWIGAGSFNNDQYSALVVKSVSVLSAGYNIGVIVRAGAGTGASRSFYGASVLQTDPSPTVVLYKYVSGTYTTLHSETVAWSANDEILLEVSGASPSNSLKVYKNRVLLSAFNTTDASALDSGLPGIAGSGGTDAYGDTWEGGNLAAASTVKPWGYYAQL